LPAPTVLGNDIWFEAEFSLSASAGVTIWLDGVQWAKNNGVRVQTSNRIEFRDANGENVFWWLDFPRAWDSDESETIGQMEVRRQGGPSSLFITVRIPYAWMQAATYPVFIDPTIDPTVSSGLYDAEEKDNNTTFNRGGTSINCSANTDTNANYNGGAIFTVTGPASGDTVDVAYATVYANNGANDDPNVDISCEDVDDSADFLTSADVTGRTRTSTPVQWTTTGIGNGATNTPSLVTPVGDVISRGGWSSGNDLCVFFDGRTDAGGGFKFDSYEGDSSSAAALHIEYTAGGATLTVADAYCVSQVDAPAVNTIYNIVSVDAFSTSQVDAVAVVTDYVLAVADSFSTSQVDEVTLSSTISLTVSDAFVTSQVDAQDVTTIYSLTVADGFSTSQVDAQDVTTNYNITVADLFSTSQVDGIVLAAAGDLVTQDAFSTSQVDAVDVTTVYVLTVADAFSTSQVDAQDVTTVYTLVTADTYSTSQVDAVTLDGATVLTVADAFVLSQVDAQDVNTDYNLTVADAHVVDVADLFGLATVYTLSPLDTFVISAVDAAVLTTSSGITPTVKTWTLRDRDTAWSLDDRDMAWSLRDRDMTWTMEER